MGIGSSCFKEKKPFKHGNPDGEIDISKLIPCFNKDNGLLFRIVEGENPELCQWHFYNDTLTFEMRIVVVFGKKSKVKKLGSTKLTTRADGCTVGEVTIFPLQTVPFVSGDINGFKSRMEALPLSKEYLQQKEREEQRRAELAEMAKKPEEEAPTFKLGRNRVGASASPRAPTAAPSKQEAPNQRQ